MTAGEPNALFAGNPDPSEPKNDNFPQELPRDFPREKGSDGTERTTASASCERFTARNPSKSRLNALLSSGAGERSDPGINKIAPNMGLAKKYGKKVHFVHLVHPRGKSATPGFPGGRGCYLCDPEQQGRLG